MAGFHLRMLKDQGGASVNLVDLRQGIKNRPPTSGTRLPPHPHGMFFHSKYLRDEMCENE
jgi:hypothetical protein